MPMSEYEKSLNFELKRKSKKVKKKRNPTIW